MSRRDSYYAHNDKKYFGKNLVNDTSNFKMYHIILSLENKNLLKPIKKEDGDYYLLVE